MDYRYSDDLEINFDEVNVAVHFQSASDSNSEKKYQAMRGTIKKMNQQQRKRK